MLQIENVSKSYGKLKVLNDISFEISTPGIYAVLGPNGSGKTTLLKSVLGMVIPEKGEIKFKNKNIKNQNDYRKDISYLPQIAHLPDNLTGRELIKLIKKIRKQNVDEKELIDIFKLQEHLDKNLKNLSGGTKQKINLVIALLFDSPVLIFDEPTAGLDPVALIRFKSILEKLKKDSKIIIFTTHIIELVEQIADNIILLLEGKIYFNGTIKKLIDKSHTTSLELAIAQILDR